MIVWRKIQIFGLKPRSTYLPSVDIRPLSTPYQLTCMIDKSNTQKINRTTENSPLAFLRVFLLERSAQIKEGKELWVYIQCQYRVQQYHLPFRLPSRVVSEATPRPPVQLTMNVMSCTSITLCRVMHGELTLPFKQLPVLAVSVNTHVSWSGVLHKYPAHINAK